MREVRRCHGGELQPGPEDVADGSCGVHRRGPSASCRGADAGRLNPAFSQDAPQLMIGDRPEQELDLFQ